MLNCEVLNTIRDSKDWVLIGVSGDKDKFSRYVYSELEAKGFRLHAVNPNAGNGDIRFVKSCGDIKDRPRLAVLFTLPSETLKAVKEAEKAGISAFFIQQGAESHEALEYLDNNKLHYIDKSCILMFAEPVKSFHRFHRWLWKISGKLKVA